MSNQILQVRQDSVLWQTLTVDEKIASLEQQLAFERKQSTYVLKLIAEQEAMNERNHNYRRRNTWWFRWFC